MGELKCNSNTIKVFEKILEFSNDDIKVFSGDTSKLIKVYSRMISELSSIKGFGDEFIAVKEILKEIDASKPLKNDDGSELVETPYQGVNEASVDLFSTMLYTPEKYLSLFKREYIEGNKGKFPLAIQEQNIHNILSSLEKFRSGDTGTVVQEIDINGVAGAGKTTFVVGNAIKMHQSLHGNSDVIGTAVYTGKAEHLQDALSGDSLRLDSKSGNNLENLFKQIDSIGDNVGIIIIDEVTLLDLNSYNAFKQKLEERNKPITIIRIGDKSQPSWQKGDPSIIKGVKGKSGRAVQLVRSDRLYMTQQFRSSVTPVVNTARKIQGEIINNVSLDYENKSEYDLGPLSNGLIIGAEENPDKEDLIIGTHANVGATLLVNKNTEEGKEYIETLVRYAKKRKANGDPVSIFMVMEDAVNTDLYKELKDIADITVTTDPKAVMGREFDFGFFNLSAEQLSIDGELSEQESLKLLNMLITRAKMFVSMGLPVHIKFSQENGVDGAYDMADNDLMINMAKSARADYESAFADINAAPKTNDDIKKEKQSEKKNAFLNAIEGKEEVDKNTKNAVKIIDDEGNERWFIDKAKEPIIDPEKSKESNEEIAKLSKEQIEFYGKLKRARSLSGIVKILEDNTDLLNDDNLITVLSDKANSVIENITSLISDTNTALLALRKNDLEGSFAIKKVIARYKGLMSSAEIAKFEAQLDYIKNQNTNNEGETKEGKNAKSETTQEEGVILDALKNPEKNPEISNEIAEEDASSEESFDTSNKEGDKELKEASVPYESSEAVIIKSSEFLDKLAEDEGVLLGYQKAQIGKNFFEFDKAILSAIFGENENVKMIKFNDKNLLEVKTNLKVNDSYLVKTELKNKETGKIESFVVKIGKTINGEWVVESHFSKENKFVKEFLKARGKSKNELYRLQNQTNEYTAGAVIINHDEVKADISLEEFMSNNPDFVFSDPFFLASKDGQMRNNGAPIVIYAKYPITKAELNNKRFSIYKKMLKNNSSNILIGNTHIGIVTLDSKKRTISELYNEFIGIDKNTKEGVGDILHMKDLLMYKDKGVPLMEIFAALYSEYVNVNNEVVNAIIGNSKKKHNNKEIFKAFNTLPSREQAPLIALLSKIFPSEEGIKVTEKKDGSKKITYNGVAFSLNAQQVQDKVRNDLGAQSYFNLSKLMSEINKMSTNSVEIELLLKNIDFVIKSRLKLGIFVTTPRNGKLSNQTFAGNSVVMGKVLASDVTVDFAKIGLPRIRYDKSMFNVNPSDKITPKDANTASKQAQVRPAKRKMEVTPVVKKRKSSSNTSNKRGSALPKVDKLTTTETVDASEVMPNVENISQKDNSIADAFVPNQKVIEGVLGLALQLNEDLTIDDVKSVIEQIVDGNNGIWATEKEENVSAIIDALSVEDRNKIIKESCF